MPCRSGAPPRPSMEDESSKVILNHISRSQQKFSSHWGALGNTPTEMTIQTLASPRNSYVLLVTMNSIPRPIAVAICSCEQRQLTLPSQWMRITSVTTQLTVFTRMKVYVVNPIGHYLGSKTKVLASVPKSEASLRSPVQHPLRHLSRPQLLKAVFRSS